MTQTLYNGEIWTDAHGFAAVVLPPGADGDLEIEVRALVDGISAELASSRRRGRFTISTSEPHVKVAWKAAARTLPRKEER